MKKFRVSHTEGSKKAEEKAECTINICVFQVEGRAFPSLVEVSEPKVERQGISMSLERPRRAISGTESVIT